MTRHLLYLIFITSFFCSFAALGQKKVKLLQAESYQGGNRNGETVQIFDDNVIFKQDKTTIFCDSAVIIGRNEVVQAYGSVRILNGDSTTITSKKATYNGNTRIAQLREKVVFKRKGKATLYTDNLDYNIGIDLANYFDGGRLVDSANVLTSVRGSLDNKTNMATFREDVVATFPDYRLESEALRYNTQTEIVYFIAPTILINNDGTTFNYNEGQYNTKARTSVLKRGQIESVQYVINAERYNINELRKTYRAMGNVEMVAKEDNVIITGDEALMNDRTKLSKVYGNPLMRKPLAGGDTLYLSADTLLSQDAVLDKDKRLMAYGNVKIFKSDLQGKSDSLVYYPADSLIKFFQSPVLWSDKNQMVADTITVFIENNKINRMSMALNSFVISRDTMNNYNQIKGRDMLTYFREGKLSRVDVDGNCESIFFALDDTEEFVMGMNKIICSNMKIYFENNAAKKVSALYQPDASFIPPHELKKENMTLRGFNWLGELRPTLYEVKNRESVMSQKDTSAPPSDKQLDTSPVPDGKLKPKPLRNKENNN